MGCSIKSVKRYLRDEKCPDWNTGRQPSTQLDEYAEFVGDILRPTFGTSKFAEVVIFAIDSNDGLTRSFVVTVGWGPWRAIFHGASLLP